MRTLAWVLALAFGALAQERAAVSLGGPARTVVVGEPVLVTLHIELDRAFFEKHAVQLFQSEMAFPVHVTLPWWRRWAAGDVLPRIESDGVRFALNDDVVAARSGGSDRVVLEQDCELVARRAGTYTLAGPVLRYAHATKFRDDFMSGRIPLDRRDETVRGAALTLVVAPLPTVGRPPAFTGAIGAFTIETSVDRRNAAVDEPFTLTMTVVGRGNLTRFATPTLRLAGFHVVGSVDDRAAPVRTIRFEVARVDARTTSVPAVSLSYFATPDNIYASASAPAIALDVAAPPVEESVEETEPDKPRRDALYWSLGGLLGVGAWLALHRRNLSRLSEAEGHARAAAARVAAPRLADTFVAYLAIRLGCPEATVIAPELAQRLRGAGISKDLAQDAAQHVEQLVAQRYQAENNETVSPSTETEVRAIVDQLEAHWCKVADA